MIQTVNLPGQLGILSQRLELERGEVKRQRNSRPVLIYGCHHLAAVL